MVIIYGTRENVESTQGRYIILSIDLALWYLIWYLIRPTITPCRCPRAHGHWNASSGLSKHTQNSLAAQLSIVMSNCMVNGTAPFQFKLAEVISVYESNDEHIFENYREISMLPSIFKIFLKNHIYTLQSSFKYKWYSAG